MRVQELEPGRFTPEEVSEALERVYAAAEFHRSESLLERALRWLSETLEFGVDPAAVGRWVVWIALGMLVLALGVLGVSLVRGALRRRAERRGMGPDLGTDVAERVAALRSAAGEARRAGELQRALRLYFFALVVGLGRRGDLEYRDAWTYRELFARGRPAAHVVEILQPLVLELEGAEFGSRPPTAGEVERVATLCETWLGPAPGERAA